MQNHMDTAHDRMKFNNTHDYHHDHPHQPDVKLILCSLVENFTCSMELKDEDDEWMMMKKLKETMNITKNKKKKGFLMNFHFVQEIVPKPKSTYIPELIYISYNHSCILLKVYDMNRLYNEASMKDVIQVFDLYTREFKTTIDFSISENDSIEFALQENYDGHNNDAIIMHSTSKHVYKCDLRTMLLQSGNEFKFMENYVWKSESCFLSPRRITILNSTNQCYICDSNYSLVVLNLHFGTFIQRIDLGSQLSSFSHIDFVDSSTMVLCDDHGVSIYNRKDDSWVKMKTINNGHRYHSILCDSISHHIIISNQLAAGYIQIFTSSGELVKTFQAMLNEDFITPRAMCINYLTGELLICDSSSQRVVFFQ
ncbi:hypothetical protein C9374_006514 [Naegleria lovaniensis]|uniref:Uncharacterized protein n=1 Tax=Naegleria lovaniensis TaxID=51637 RepID=A0AA88GP80_NAELO|nr:uncharacterized protein C9374_006514 [Naegleria lovaniensis]KAG2381525.1 hypothetical protein C9374_006514 [Naegleria lovaniensis]